MGVKVLGLITLLVISVIGQESVVNEVTIQSENAPVVVPSTEASPVQDELLEDEVDAAPIEILNNTDQLLIRSGNYQVAGDVAVGEDTIAVNLASNTAPQSENQILFPPDTTQVTNNEYGKFNLYNFIVSRPRFVN